MPGFLTYIIDNHASVWQYTIEHMVLVSSSLLIAILIGVPLGVFIAYHERLAPKVLNIANILMTIPSIALFGLMMPLLAPIGHGLGSVPAITALVLYSQLPLIRNTYVAIKNIPPPLINAGQGIGLPWHVLLFELKIPLAIPYILSGIRNAMVLNIGIAAIATYIGAGGLGQLIQFGINRMNYDMVTAGAILIALLAIILDILLHFIEKQLTPKGVKYANNL